MRPHHHSRARVNIEREQQQASRVLPPRDVILSVVAMSTSVVSPACCHGLRIQYGPQYLEAGKRKALVSVQQMAYECNPRKTEARREGTAVDHLRTDMHACQFRKLHMNVTQGRRKQDGKAHAAAQCFSETRSFASYRSHQRRMLLRRAAAASYHINKKHVCNLNLEQNPRQSSHGDLWNANRCNAVH